jgi:periplasmic divalent cation tolerance protein
MANSTYVVVFITTSSETEARQISDALLTRRKAACVNIIPTVNSSFWWQGKLESAAESLLMVKTKASLVDEVVALVKENHSYTVPEIIALPIIGGNPDYLEWIEKAVK